MLFELLHLDIKSFDIDSYQKFKYVITFLNDFTSYVWTVRLCTKAAALTTTQDFLQLVKVQHNAAVKGWMSDAGGEYKSDAFDKMLCECSIRIFQSTPHTPMQNGHAEQLMCTLMDKVETMRLDSCLSDSLWDFVFTHVTHLYNWAPMQCL